MLRGFVFVLCLIGMLQGACWSKSLDRAVEAYYQGQYSKTIDLLTSENDTVQGRLLLASSYLKNGQPVMAQKILSAIQPMPAIAVPYARLLRFQIAKQTPSFSAESVADLFPKGAIESAVDAQMMLEWADRNEEVGLFEQAKKQYFLVAGSKISAGGLRLEAWQALVKLGLQTNDRDTTLKYAQKCLALQGFAPEILTMMETISATFPDEDMVAPLMESEKQAFTWLTLLMQKRHYKELVNYVNQYLNKWPSSSNLNAVRLMLAMGNYYMYEFDKAFDAFDAIVLSASDRELVAKAVFYQARCHERRRRVDLALGLYARLAADYPRTQVTALGYYYWIKLLASQKQLGRVAEVERQFQDRCSRSSYYHKWVWEQVTEILKKGEYDKAYTKLASIDVGVDDEDDSLSPFILLWKVKLEKRLGITSDTADLCLKHYPLSYAAYRIISDQSPDAFASFQSAFAAKWANSPYTVSTRVSFLTEAGFGDLVVRDYEDRLGNLLHSRKQTAYELMWMYTRMGSYGKAKSVGATYFPLSKNDVPGDILRLLFPQAYLEEVTQSSSEFGVEPSFIHAVIRAESAYYQKARSRVGAMGLMQIMPSTAEGIASKLGDPWTGPDPVLDPAKNIRYGTYYLSTLKKRFPGNQAYVLSGYNAGPGITKQWQTQFNTTDPDVVILKIPYAETQGYVLKVLSYYWVYKILFGIL